MMIFLIIFAFVSSTFVCGLEENCDTLGGKCISIHDCDVLKPYIKISSSTREIVKKYHCGFDGNVPRVCCPPEHCTFLELMSQTCGDDYYNEDYSEPGPEALKVTKHQESGLKQRQKPM